MGSLQREDTEIHEDEDTASKYLTFGIGGDVYALPIANVTEIVGLQEITYIPEVPPYVAGVINLRGRVIPVVDVRLRFAKPARDYDSRTCIIVVSLAGEGSIGLVVDTVREVSDIDDSEIEDPPGMTLGSGAGFMTGIAKHEGQVTVILDTSRLVGTTAMGAIF